MDANDELPAEDPVSETARALFGIDYLFPYQRLVIENALEAAEGAGLEIEWPPGRASEAAGNRWSAVADAGSDADVRGLGRQIVILPTGAGKSLCFQLPALILSRPTLVVYPILSLMADQERRLKERGCIPAVLRGGQSAEERRAVWNRIESGDARFAISNPETLLAEPVLRRLETAGIAHLVVDEAHCVSEWGESFRPSYLRIDEIRRAARAPLTTAFTATASAPVLEKIERYVFGAEAARRIVGNPDRPNIDYAAVGTLLRDRTVADILSRAELPAVVFCSSRAGTERLSRSLRAELPDAEIRFYHAGLDREEKDAVERWFFGARRAALVATCAYGMGVDKPDVRTVVHRDCPPSAEAYLQESGRAGRDGKPSRAYLLWGPEDEAALARAEDGPARDRVAALLAYARGARRCRREVLLEMMGAAAEFCSGCDVCRGEASEAYRERSSLLAFAERNRRRYGLDEAARIIAGGGTVRWSVGEAKSALERLVADGALRKRRDLFWSGTIEPATRRR